MMGMISRKQAGFAVLGLMTAVFLFFLTGYVHCKQGGSQPPAGHNAFIFGDAHSYVAESRLSFEGGYAVLGLYDTPAALEFSERQPLVVPLQRQGNRIVLAGLPPAVAGRAKARPEPAAKATSAAACGNAIDPAAQTSPQGRICLAGQG